MPRYLLLVFAFGAVAATLTACANIERTSWILTAQPDPSDTMLQLSVLVGACDKFDHFDVRETEVGPDGQLLVGAVTIEAYIHTDARSGCDDHGPGPKEQTVEISAPLGDRRLKGCSPPSAKYGPVRSDLPNDDCAASILGGGGETDAPETGTTTPEATGQEAFSYTLATEWRLTAAPQGASLNLLVAVGDSCDSFERLDVRETIESVTVDAIILRLVSPNWDCIDYLHSEWHAVQLDAPLGERELLGCDPLPGALLLGYDVVGDCAARIFR